jgi:hypothetical protein
MGIPASERVVGGLELMPRKSITKEDIAPAIVSTVPWRLTKVKPFPDFVLEVEFVDGTRGTVDMKSLILGQKAGVFAKLRDITLFNKVRIELGAATWPGEIDLAPDAMYDEIKQNGKWVL